MSSTIPPLVCDTPPPIDFDNDDDFGGFETNDGQYDDEHSLPTTPKYKSNILHSNTDDIPVPVHESDDEIFVPIIVKSITSPIPTSVIPEKQFEEIIEASVNVLNADSDPTDTSIVNAESEDSLNIDYNINDTTSIISNNITDDASKGNSSPILSTQITSDAENSANFSHVINSETIEFPAPENYEISNRSESPPSLELLPEKYLDNECDINANNDDDDFNDFNQQNNDELNANKTDDSASLPSLNLDSMRNSPEIKSDEQDIGKINESESEQFARVETTEILDEPNSVMDLDDADASGMESSSVITKEIETNQIIEPTNAELSSFSVAKETDSPEESNEFDADFSQFNAFETVTEVKTIAATINTNSNDNNLNIEDDFGNFEEANVDDDNDDFGEFNDFQQKTVTTPTISSAIQSPSVPSNPPIDIQTMSLKLKSLLDTIFPNDEELSEATDHMHTKPNTATNTFLNSTTIQLNDFENSKASTHQWVNSCGKATLVKALGIDSRNILYGEKWNSSMPRFAANLSFNPLEPLKSASTDSTSNNNMMHANFNESMSKGGMISAKAPFADVPAVQFDWNSSGLVNPLDASHAHTLLLDLKEQLVVVANLDKIKLDSSPYSTCNASQSTSNYVSSISSPSSSTTTKTTKTTSIIVNSNSSVAGIVCKKIINSKQNHLTSTHIERNNVMNGSVDRSTYFGYTTNTFGSINTINANHNFFNKNNNKSLVLDNAYRMEFDPYFDFRAQEIVHKTDTAKDRSSGSNINRKKSIENAATNNEQFQNDDIISAATATTTKIVSAIQTELGVKCESFEPSPTSASYTVPGSSGTLKETHIFTPSKLPITSSSMSESLPSSETLNHPLATNTYAEFDFEKSAAGVIINENVVKKEYRDVEYNPDKITNVNLENDEFSDFQSVEATPTCIKTNVPSIDRNTIVNSQSDILEPTKTSSNISINWPDPGTVIDTTALEGLSNYVPKTFISNSMASHDFSSVKSVDFTKPVIGTSPSDNMFASSMNPEISETKVAANSIDEFSEFQSTESNSISYISHVSAIPDIISLTKTHSNRTDDNDKKEILPDVFQHTVQMKINAISSEKSLPWQHFNGNNIEPETQSSNSLTNPVSVTKPVPTIPFMSSNILVPQVTTTFGSSSINQQPKIEWPEPGMNSDELARLEKFYPQPASATSSQKPTINHQKNVKTSEEDEWSEFVSVTQPQTPITNILNQNLQKHQADDDDWSEFVSSAAAPSSQQMQNNQWNTNCGPNFTSWNAPSQFNSWQNSTNFPTRNNHENGFAHTENLNVVNHITNNKQLSNQPIPSRYAPSIISLPDLGFIAPMPRTNFTKK